MPGWRSSVAFLILASLIILLDGFLWETSQLSLWIGQIGGVSAPIDNRMEDLLGARIIQEHLEEKLEAATTPKEQLVAMYNLAKHFEKENDSEKERLTRRKLLKQFGTMREKEVYETYLRMFKMAADADGDVSDMRPLLERARALGNRQPIDTNFLDFVATAAAKLGETEFQLETLRQVSRNTSLSISKRFAIMQKLMALLKKKARPEDDAERAHLLSILNAYEKVRAEQKAITTKIQALVKELKISDAYRLYTKTLAEHPDWKDALGRIFESIRLAALSHRNPEVLQSLWPDIMQMELGTGEEENAENFIDGFLFICAQTFLANDMEDEFLKIARVAVERFPDLDMIPYLQGELWARTGRTGEPPASYYAAAYKPGASIRIDGNFDEPEYQGLKPLPGPFWREDGYERIVQPAGDSKLHARMFYTETDLYIAIEIPDPRTEVFKKYYRSATPGAEPFWQEAMDVFMEEKRILGEHRQYIALARGTFAFYHYDRGKDLTKHHMGFGELLGRETPNNLEGEQALQILPGKILHEIRMPLAIFFPDGKNPKGKLVRFNLRRIITTPKKTEGFPAELEPNTVTSIAWSRQFVATQTHQWGLLEFSE